mgnify:CR=1 FL=1
MQKLTQSLDGKLKFAGKVIQASPIGRPRTLQADDNDELMLALNRSIPSTKADAYVLGTERKDDYSGLRYIPIQFYKLK